MDEARLAAGKAAFVAGDWKTAARDYLAAVHGLEPPGTGRAYHQAGNALMKLGRYEDAATVYGHSIRDVDYDRRAVVFANLGAALAAAGRLEDAVPAYEAALADPSYPSPYKAMQGKASALYDLGRYEDAALAYRQAAWADGNPDPGKALNNLGLCFMALGKPEEAVEPYRAALGTEGYASKGKAAANLGLAYAQMGFHDEAVSEFEAARDIYAHPLNGAALAAYEASLAALRPRDRKDDAPASGAQEAQAEVVERPAGDWGEQDHTGEEPAETVDDDTKFFTITEEEMRAAERDARRAERGAKRTRGSVLARVGIVVAALLVVGGGIAALVYFGFGFPTQEQTVGSMLDAYRNGKAYADYWVAVPQTDVKQEMRQLPARFVSFRVDGVDRSALKSTARVTIKLSSGSNLAYDVLLVREGVGWKVNGIRNAWTSATG